MPAARILSHGRLHAGEVRELLTHRRQLDQPDCQPCNTEVELVHCRGNSPFRGDMLPITLTPGPTQMVEKPADDGQACRSGIRIFYMDWIRMSATNRLGYEIESYDITLYDRQPRPIRCYSGFDYTRISDGTSKTPAASALL